MSKFNLSALSKPPQNLTNAYDTLMGTFTEIVDIEISQIDDFKEHPYKVQDDEAMFELAESIKVNGQLTPVIVRKKDDNRYEMISGHRRKRACELAEINTIKAEVKELSNEQAIIAMVDANLQRPTILPSEKAKAYKMRLEAVKQQGTRNDFTSSQHETNLRSDEIVAEEVGESRAQVQRYIRLNELIPELLTLVDSEEIGVLTGVELSYLTEEEQTIVNDFMGSQIRKVTISQARQLRELSKENALTEKSCEGIFKKTSHEAKEKVNFKVKRDSFEKYIPNTASDKDFSELIERALEFYFSHDNKQD